MKRDPSHWFRTSFGFSIEKSASKKISCLALCALLLGLGAPAAAEQPGKVHRIGLLQSASPEATFLDGFRQGLRELGYIEGRHFTLETRFGEMNPQRLSSLAAELVRLKADIIVAGGNPAIHAAMKATTTIPIVMRIGSDPVRAGVVASLAHPGGNITGVASINLDLIGKRFELLMEIVPGIKRVAVLLAQTNPTAFMGREEYKEMEAAARALGVKLQILSARDPNTIDNAFLEMTRERPQALIVIPNPRYVQNRKLILERASKNHLPTIYPHSLFVDNGGLMSYGPDFADEYRRLAIYVDKILKGAKPADLPVEQPTKVELVINLKIAKQIGLIIPPNVLARADRIIR
jgi:putative ABC transport system substrate-binding protein